MKKAKKIAKEESKVQIRKIERKMPEIEHAHQIDETETSALTLDVVSASASDFEALDDFSMMFSMLAHIEELQ